ncbi:ubiquitin 3 binding protein But2 C-terminal domain-containing protein [Biscogniauxia marginata]|nr:ubiquitin 3 binding protein But2 C-terminal domain-containing protein [Biscogniauxia marginata]
MASGTYAITSRQDGCAFTLTTSVSTHVGQYGSGQTRAGPGETPSNFIFNGDTIIDAQGRGCWWTPPATVLQCDVGQTPETGFSIDCDGTLSYNGQTTFYECATNYPHLIIPVDSGNPDTSYGTSYFGEVTSSVSSIFDFDIPKTDNRDKTCNIVFPFPTLDKLETSSFNFSGSGAIEFARLDSAARSTTTFNTLPGVAKTYDQLVMAPGNAYTLDTFVCPAGTTIAFEMSNAAGGSTDSRFFQDYNPWPLGLYITTS